MDGTGVDIFRATVSLQIFKFLLRCLRFDDANSREARNAVDKLAPIRDLFEHFRKTALCTIHLAGLSPLMRS